MRWAPETFLNFLRRYCCNKQSTSDTPTDMETKTTKASRKNPHFQLYMKGYLASLYGVDPRTEATAINDMIKGWDMFEAAVGAKPAVAVWNRWMASLPEAQRSDVNPNGY